MRKIKNVQFIYTFKKVGLMNQTPTEEPLHEKIQNPYVRKTKFRHKKN